MLLLCSCNVRQTLNAWSSLTLSIFNLAPHFRVFPPYFVGNLKRHHILLKISQVKHYMAPNVYFKCLSFHQSRKHSFKALPLLDLRLLQRKKCIGAMNWQGTEQKKMKITLHCFTWAQCDRAACHGQGSYWPPHTASAMPTHGHWCTHSTDRLT